MRFSAHLPALAPLGTYRPSAGKWPPGICPLGSTIRPAALVPSVAVHVLDLGGRFPAQRGRTRALSASSRRSPQAWRLLCRGPRKSADFWGVFCELQVRSTGHPSPLLFLPRYHQISLQCILCAHAAKLLVPVHRFGRSGVYLCSNKKKNTMLEIVITVAIYVGVVALLVKAAFTFCRKA